MARKLVTWKKNNMPGCCVTANVQGLHFGPEKNGNLLIIIGLYWAYSVVLVIIVELGNR